jgi:hypothetical protein
MMMRFKLSLVLFLATWTLLVSHVYGSVEKWSLTLLLECSNPHNPNQRHFRSSLCDGSKESASQLSSTATCDTLKDSSTSSIEVDRSSKTSIKKARTHPISSVFESSFTTDSIADSLSSNAHYQDADYQRRKQEWMSRYTTLNGLRNTFGGNRNKLWGDLDPVTTRKLYKSLLPTALCELVLDLGVPPEELAPLAYAARKAAKLYARERSRVPTRIAASAYDGFRQLQRYGKFQPAGMSYDQVWDKYRRLTYLETTTTTGGANGKANRAPSSSLPNSNDWSEEDLVARTCMKIIESSCRTNPRIDQLTLRGGQTTTTTNAKLGRAEMKKIAQTMEDDVRRLLDPYSRQ